MNKKLMLLATGVLAALVFAALRPWRPPGNTPAV